MKPFDYSFENIGIRCIDRLIQVENQRALKTFLDKPGNGSMTLAKEMKRRYREDMGMEINITQKSLAIEVLGHVYVGEIAKLARYLPIPVSIKIQLKKVMDEIKKHVDIIDCGEKEVDDNRVIWDSLEKYADQIFAIMADYA